MMSLVPSFPKMSFPLCPSTVEIGKFGISLYASSFWSVIWFTSSPKPVPNIIAVAGIIGKRSLINAAVSLIFSIIANSVF